MNGAGQNPSQNIARMPPGLRAQALSWPLTFVGPQMLTTQGVGRVRQALEHLVRTPMGAYWIDLEYGTIFDAVRTQHMTQSSSDGGVLSGGLVDSAVAHFQRQVSIYCPGIVLHSVHMFRQSGARLRVDIVWTVKSLRGQGALGALPDGGGLGSSLSVVL